MVEDTFSGGATAPDLLVWTVMFLQMFSHLREGVGTNVGAVGTHDTGGP